MDVHVEIISDKFSPTFGQNNFGTVINEIVSRSAHLAIKLFLVSALSEVARKNQESFPPLGFLYRGSDVKGVIDYYPALSEYFQSSGYASTLESELMKSVGYINLPSTAKIAIPPLSLERVLDDNTPTSVLLQDSNQIVIFSLAPANYQKEGAKIFRQAQYQAANRFLDFLAVA